ncbi:MAG: hypothetical protein NTZ16_02870, partial [Verrucomicrobia bacterium]|nr:hypothetical protein [Verrucomicrobiota bacterium]
EVEAGGQTLRGAEAAHMQTVISHKPPAPGETYTNRPIFTVSPQCLAPDNGQGTAYLPPTCCAYTSSNDTMHIVDGLPPGTTIQLTPTNRDFACLIPAGSGECFVTDDHTPTNGEMLQYTSTLQFGLHGTGALAGYNRTLTIPGVQCVTHNNPRTPGTPVQSFDTDMLQMQGQLPPGDPDFDLLRITAGNSFGLPSPGHTTMTQQPGGDWAVDSFFDITYRIDYIGAPGGALPGHSGSTTATIRMSTGNVCSNTAQGIQLLTTNGQPTGIWLMQETHTPNPVIEVDTFNCTAAQITLQLPSGKYEVVNLSGPATVHVLIPPNGLAADTDGDGLDQVPTEMVALNLVGSSSLGSVLVRLAASQPSLGEIEEQVNKNPGTLDVPPFTATGTASSFFDVFFEIQVGQQTLHGAGPAHLMALLTHKPPAEGETYGNPNMQPIPLLDANGQPTGMMLIQAAHTPNPVRPRLDVTVLPNQQIQICWPELPPCYRLQHRPKLDPDPAMPWKDVLTLSQSANGMSCVTLDASGTVEFFRLIQD